MPDTPNCNRFPVRSYTTIFVDNVDDIRFDVRPDGRVVAIPRTVFIDITFGSDAAATDFAYGLLRAVAQRELQNVEDAQQEAAEARAGDAA